MLHLFFFLQCNLIQIKIIIKNYTYIRNFARVSAPLCFNFLNMIKVQNTAFNKVMGEINIVPIFGSGFTSVFPIILIVLCLFNIYDVYGKFLSYLGLKQFQFAENFKDEKINEGKQLLYKGKHFNIKTL